MHHYLYVGDVGPKELKQLKGVLFKPPRARRLRRTGFPRHPIEYVVREEDYATGLRQQQGLLSGARSHVLFGRNEGG